MRTGPIMMPGPSRREMESESLRARSAFWHSLLFKFHVYSLFMKSTLSGERSSNKVTTQHGWLVCSWAESARSLFCDHLSSALMQIRGNQIASYRLLDEYSLLISPIKFYRLKSVFLFFSFLPRKIPPSSTCCSFQHPPLPG